MSLINLSKLNLFLILLLAIKKVNSWYSSCDQVGRCYISEKEDMSDKIYLEPGMLPILFDGEVIPLASEEGQKDFPIESLTGFPRYGELPGTNKYECAGGLNECINSCCNDKGKCSDTLNSCSEKRDNVNLVYIITCSVYIAFIIIYWVVYFIFGCNYNKKAIEELQQRTKQGYDNPINVNPEIFKKKDEDIPEDVKDEQDISAAEVSRGSEENDDEEEGDKKNPNNNKQENIQKIVSNIDKIKGKNIENDSNNVNNFNNNNSNTGNDNNISIPQRNKLIESQDSSNTNNIQNDQNN